MAISRRELTDLRNKYAEMRTLREEHARGDVGDPRPRLIVLASRFPGALREIDELPLESILHRIEALTAAEDDETRVESWMIAMAMFHALTRGALSVKRWLRGRKEADASVRAAFVQATLAYPEDARRWANHLDAVARPPRGRITEAVFERVAVALDVSPREARLLVFGTSRRERRTSDCP